MSTTPIAPYARVRDLNLDTIIAHSTALLDWSIDWALDGPGNLMVEVALGDAVASAMIACTGGPDGTATPLPYLLELSLDGGATVDARKMIEHPVSTMSMGTAGIREDGPTIFAGFQTAGIDRASFYNAKLQDILYGGAGQIPVAVAGQPAFTLRYQKGFYQTTPGNAGWAGKARLAMVPVVDAMLATTPVSVDLELDTIGHATQVVVNAGAGLYNSGDAAHFGFRGHFVPDSSDASLNLTGVTRGIAIGYAGKASGLTFLANQSSAVASELTQGIALEVARTPNLDGIYAQAAFRGGTSTHGMPDGGSVSNLAILNGTVTGLAWDASLLLVGITTGGNGGGGAFYYPHDGTLHRFSPAMDVADICTNGSDIYIATPTGVKKCSVSPASSSPTWTAVGGLAANIVKIWYADNGLHAIASGAGVSADGVYLYGTGDVANSGYSGWGRAVQAGGALIGAGGGAGGVLFADSNDPAAVTIGSTRIPIPNDSAVTGIDAYSGYIFVRTSAGASAVYTYTGGALVNLNQDNTLVDVAGNPVMVNKIIPYSGALLTQPVFFIACTDQGLFYAHTQTGGWVNATTQNGLGSTSVYCVAAGQPQNLIATDTSTGRLQSFVYAANASQLFISRSEGLYAFDLLAAPLDMGPAWQAAARQAGLVPFADNGVGGLASSGVTGMVAAGSYQQGNPPATGYVNLGGAGAVIQIPVGQDASMPAGYVWARRLDEHNDWTYRLININSGSPYNAWMPAELTELQTNALVGVITASFRVFVAALRWLAQATRGQTTYTWASYFITQEAAQRRLRPTMRAALTDVRSITGPITTTVVMAYAASNLYCLTWHIGKSPAGDAAETSGSFGLLLQTQRLSPEEVAADLNTKIKNLSTYGGP